MNDGERLAAYLVGDLDPAERRELEARLEREPSLRDRLQKIRRSDELLASLPEVSPRPGFSSRLRSELRGELSAARQSEDTDELAARRRQREVRTAPRWLAPLGAAAAVLALFAVVGVAITSMSGSDEEAATTGLESAEMDADAGQAADDGAAAARAADGPVIVSLGRSFTSDDVTEILDDPSFEPVLGIGEDEASETADRYRAAFGAIQLGTQAQETGDAAAGEPVEESAQPPLEIRGDAGEEALTDVQRCLPQLFEEAGTLVPVYAELATFEGEPVVVYGLVGQDPSTGEFSQTEIWVVSREDCQVRYFTQS